MPPKPSRERFGLVVYRAPEKAFRDNHNVPTSHTEVRLTGRYEGSIQVGLSEVASQYGTVEPGNQYGPGDDFLTLRAPNAETCSFDLFKGETTKVPVKTFGMLVEVHVAEGEQVAPVARLFSFDARPSTTTEWQDQEDAWLRVKRDLATLERNTSGLNRYLHWRWEERQRRRAERRSD